jgi:hypothetical protein
VALVAPAALATTQYHLRVHALPQIPQRFVFSLTCSDSSNQVMILDAQHDGVGDVTSTEGGPLVGRLIGGYNPADTTIIVGGTFYSEISLLVQSFTQFDCGLEVTEEAPQLGVATSQFALYWRDQDDDVRIATDDPLGADALAAIDITGAPGGELSVFYPLTFVAPDTLLLAGDVVGVPRPAREPERLRFSSIAPNPAREGVRFAFELSRQGIVRLRVYDVAGRLVAEPLRTTCAAGSVSLEWNGRGRSGRPEPAGVYVAELRFGTQTAVRRFVFAR